MPKPRGKFIVVEGIDGSGKTSSIKLATSRLQEVPIRSLKGFTHRSTWDRHIDAHPRSLLYYLDMIYKTFWHIRPALARGEHVIQDRYIHSIDSFLPDAQFLHNMVLRLLLSPFFLAPDVFVLFLADAGTIVSRLKTTRETYHVFLAEHPERIAERQQEYMKIYEHIGGTKHIIDTTHDTPPETASLLEKIICDAIRCQ